MSEQPGSEWRFTTFGTIAKRLVNGGTPPTQLAAYWNGTIPWITGADFTPSGLSEFRRYVSKDALAETSTNVISKGELLLVTRTGVGKLAIAPCDVAISQDITGAYADREQVDVDFLFHRMRRGVEDLKRLNQGTSINGIVRSDLVNYSIHLPPVPEQQRIAEILTTVDDAIEQTEALIAKMQQVKAGLMHDLFTRGVTPDGKLRPPREEAPHIYKESPLGWIPKEWEVCPIDHVLANIIDYRGKTPKKTDAGVPLLTAKNVRMGFIEPEPREFIADMDYSSWMTRGIPTVTDVIFTTEAPMGNVAQVGTSERVAFAQRVIILQPRQGIRPSWLKFRLMNHDFQTGVATRASGTTALGIKQSEFRKLPLTYPIADDEQSTIERILLGIENEEREAIASRSKLRETKVGLMHDLLSGRVRVPVSESQ